MGQLMESGILVLENIPLYYIQRKKEMQRPRKFSRFKIGYIDWKPLSISKWGVGWFDFQKSS